MTIYVVIDITCSKCGTDANGIGVYQSREDAEGFGMKEPNMSGRCAARRIIEFEMPAHQWDVKP
jgi:hypothetical protein